VRNPSAVSPRFPGGGSSARGESEPKSRPKGVDDGKQVNIPVPPHGVEAGRTEKVSAAGYWMPVQGRRVVPRKAKLGAVSPRTDDVGASP
jgi:hypothetical protein